MAGLETCVLTRLTPPTDGHRPETFDAAQAGDSTWLATVYDGRIVQIVCHVNKSNTTVAASIHMPAEAAVVQLGVPVSCQQPHALLVIVTVDCRAWAFCMDTAAHGMQLSAEPCNCTHAPISIAGVVGYQLAALVAWEFLGSFWTDESLVGDTATAIMPTSNGQTNRYVRVQEPTHKLDKLVLGPHVTQLDRQPERFHIGHLGNRQPAS
jgi:hypothetical protein